MRAKRWELDMWLLYISNDIITFDHEWPWKVKFKVTLWFRSLISSLELFLCKIIGNYSFIWTTLGVSTFNLILVNVDQYICIVFGNQYEFLGPKSEMGLRCSVLEVLPSALYLPPKFYLTSIFDGVCHIHSLWPSPYVLKFCGIVHFVVVVSIPLAVFAIWYPHIEFCLVPIAVESGVAKEREHANRD